MHLLAFFDFLPKRLMFPQIIRSTHLDTPCLQQSRKKKTHDDYLFFEKILQGSCADVFTRPTLLWLHANGRNASPVTEQKKCWNLFKFDWFQTLPHECQCGSMQTDAICWAQQCCVLLANNVASVFMGLKMLKLVSIPFEYGRKV